VISNRNIAEYDQLCKWRSAWYAALNRPVADSQNNQDKIIRRIHIANMKISGMLQRCNDVTTDDTYYHPRDDNDQRWIIIFEDADVGNQIYFDEQEAIAAYERLECNWNCHLFQSVQRNTK